MGERPKEQDPQVYSVYSKHPPGVSRVPGQCAMTTGTSVGFSLCVRRMKGLDAGRLGLYLLQIPVILKTLKLAMFQFCPRPRGRSCSTGDNESSGSAAPARWLLAVCEVIS